MGCPQCGQHDTVLQSVVSTSFECRPELGGCGANFDQSVLANPEKVADIRSALDTMLDAISSFESRDLSRNLSKDDPERLATDELVTRLRQQIATLTSALS